MKPTPDKQRPDDRHRKEPRAKGSTKHALTAIVRAVGAEEADFMTAGSGETTKARQRAGKRGKA